MKTYIYIYDSMLLTSSQNETNFRKFVEKEKNMYFISNI